MKNKIAKEKKTEPKMLLEREYVVPLRREWLKVQKYKRANKAIKALKVFIARHMKLYDDDLRKVKIPNLDRERQEEIVSFYFSNLKNEDSIASHIESVEATQKALARKLM